ncbi:MAG TPA: tripartite tricarboxylate transporter substrate binding protein [Burkholderiaceae bacterium]|nr:tripartite tricarboxylate transporter substrate binding protein [Burkholderiaceae bacterium]
MPIDRRSLLLAPLASLPMARARAQAFPARPIRYIVPVAAGGGSDLVARTTTEAWSRALGQGFVVENIGGGGGVIACQTTAKAPADGYTLLQGYVATHGTSPATRSKLPYDAIRDFTPVGMIGATPNVLVVNAALPVATIAEFVAYLKRTPGGLSYGSAGQGSLTHLTMELFKQAIGAFIVHLPYRGIAPAFTDLLGGQTHAMFPGLAAALPHIRSGRVRALAVTGAQRHPLLKDTPTMIEAGFAGFDAVQWYGVVGPAGLPAPVTKQLNDTLAATLAAPALADKLSAEAVQPTPMTPDAFAAFIRDDIARWTKLARDRKIDLDN